jgi:hypothetical protein
MRIQEIDWDHIFDLKVWHTVKWVWMAIISVALVFFIYQSHQQTSNTLNDILFEIKLNQEQTLIECIQRSFHNE